MSDSKMLKILIWRLILSTLKGAIQTIVLKNGTIVCKNGTVDVNVEALHVCFIFICILILFIDKKNSVKKWRS